MDRRSFLARASTVALGSLGAATVLGGSGCSDANSPRDHSGVIMTVTGPISPNASGIALVHEHVASIFGLDPADPAPYDRDAAMAAILPHLDEARGLGVATLVECTAAYFGRDVELLRALSEASGMQIVTNTGYYGAADDRYVPTHVRVEDENALADRWTAEWLDGIDGTGIRPGFMKIGVDGGPLSDTDAKLVRAAARTHLRTGLTMSIHTGNNVPGALEQLGILYEESVAPNAWIWTHANSVEETAPLLDAADRGAWIALDGFRPERLDQFLQHLEGFREAGRLDRVLLSHDGNTYPRNGTGDPRGFSALFTDLLPALLDRGWTQEEIDRITRENPRKAFTVRVRALA